MKDHRVGRRGGPVGVDRLVSQQGQVVNRAESRFRVRLGMAGRCAAEQQQGRDEPCEDGRRDGRSSLEPGGSRAEVEVVRFHGPLYSDLSMIFV